MRSINDLTIARTVSYCSAKCREAVEDPEEQNKGFWVELVMLKFLNSFLMSIMGSS